LLIPTVPKTPFSQKMKIEKGGTQLAICMTQVTARLYTRSSATDSGPLFYIPTQSTIYLTHPKQTDGRQINTASVSK